MGVARSRYLELVLLVSRLFAVVVACLVLAASASAADPLLSGYSGPGGGDQALIGGKATPASKRSGDGSLRAGAGAGARGSGEAPVVIAADVPLTAQPAPQGGTPDRGRGSAPRRGASRAGGGTSRDRTDEPGSDAAPFAVVSAVRYPATSADTGPLLSTEAVLGLLLACLALAGVAVGTARLAGRHPE